MKLLLDTQCWLWWFSAPDRLNTQAITTVADEANELWLSVASVWEIGIKVAIGKLSLPEPPETYLPKRLAMLGAKSLDINAAHALRAAALPAHHKDLFDRMLIAQAQVEDFTVVTTDSAFNQYPDTPILWAGSN